MNAVVEPRPPSPTAGARGANLLQRVLAIVGWIVVASGVALRLRLFLSDRSLWLDPAMLALNVVHRDSQELFGRLDWNQSAPVGFLLLSKVFGELGGYGERALLAAPLLFGSAALVLFHRLVTKLTGNGWAPAIVMPMAVSSTAVFYSAEFKQYSADLFFSVVLLLLTARVLESRFSRRDRILLLTAALIAPWFSHASWFVALPCLAVFARRSLSLPKVQTWALAGVGAVVACSAVVYLAQVRPTLPAGVVGYHAAGFPPLSSISDLLGWSVSTARGYFSYPLQVGFAWPAVAVAIAAGLLPADRTDPRREPSDNARALVLAAAMALLSVGAASALRMYPISTGVHDVNARFVLFTLPLVLVLVASGLARLRQVASIVGLLVAGALAAGSLSALSSTKPFIREEMRPLVADLAERMESGDLVFVYSFAVPAFDYYTRDAAIPAHRAEIGADPASELSRYLSKNASSTRLWLVVCHDYSDAHASLRTVVVEEWSRTARKRWPGCSLERWQRHGSVDGG